jgi:tetratricopeptide (TPR) repeat protein
MERTRDARERMTEKRQRGQRIFVLAAVLMVVGLMILIPPVRTAIGYRLDDMRTRLTYLLNPPDEAVFVPVEQGMVETIIAGTMQAVQSTPTPEPTPQITADPDATAAPTELPPPAPTALPPQVDLREKVTYVHQHERWNYCGPANLTMALNYWGWTGNRDDVAKVIKPGESDPTKNFIDRGKADKNVMPYEMAGFVNDSTEFSMLWRYGGEIQVIKNLIANGFPVVIEKGYYERDYTGKIAWMGHYLFVTGYDEGEGVFIVQDAYLEPGENLRVPYEEFNDGWRGFNYLFMVAYPPAEEGKVLDLLGPWADIDWANRHALDLANVEIGTESGIDLFFAWFNKGTSHVQLFEYVDAAFAYDYAFVLYDQIGEPNEAETVETQRPYRIMWYQTGPYWAYYYSGRYQDVINLANVTLYETISEPTLEESLYWRALAYLALGEVGNAVADLQQTVYLNPSFTPGREKLQELGVTP